MHWSELSVELPAAPSGRILYPPLLSAFLNWCSINEMCFCARGWTRVQVSWRLSALYLLFFLVLETRLMKCFPYKSKVMVYLTNCLRFEKNLTLGFLWCDGLNALLFSWGVGLLCSGLLVCPGWIPVLPWIGFSCPPWPCLRMKGCLYITTESVVFPFIPTQLPTVFLY